MFGFSSLRCSDCENLDKYDRNNYGEAYCPVDRNYVSLDSHTCRDFQPNFYVMTAYCVINKISFKSNLMTTLIGFRDCYMMNNKKGKDFLMEYEGIGPIIAGKLLTDMYRVDVVKNMEEEYVNPMISFIQEQRFEDAQDTYISMIDRMKLRYGYSEIKDNSKTKRL